MAFEVFTREFVRSSAPKVTITSLGRFSINNGASALLKTNPQTEWVLLLWDGATNRVAIQPVKKGDIRAYPLKAYGPKGRSGTGFSAVTFLNFINYDWSETRSFAAEWTEGMLVFKIGELQLIGKLKIRDSIGTPIVGDKIKRMAKKMM
jgi:hypothetical protein